MGKSFGISNDRSSSFNTQKLEIMLSDVHHRLSGVTIENLDWQDLIKRLDRDVMLCYLDPPYSDCDNDYGKKMLAKDDYVQMAKSLKAISGTFILSINDVPEIRKIFKGFKQDTVSLNYSISGGKGTAAKELIISG